MKVYDSYITINIDSKEKEMLNKIAIRKGKKLSRMIYEEYIKKLLEDENESKKREEFRKENVNSSAIPSRSLRRKGRYYGYF